GDVREAEYRPGPRCECRPVQLRQQPHDAVAATKAPDAVHSRIGKRPGEVGEPFVIAARVISRTPEHVPADQRLPAERTRVLLASRYVVRTTQWTRRRDQRHSGSGRKRK